MDLLGTISMAFEISFLLGNFFSTNTAARLQPRVLYSSGLGGAAHGAHGQVGGPDRPLDQAGEVREPLELLRGLEA